jgi:nucleotide-binding universal stress UspA family protein
LDGTPSSKLAVNAVASRAWPVSSEVRLVTVVDANRGNFILQPKKNSARSMKRDTVEEFMKEAIERLRAAQLSVSTRIEEGDPKHVLIADAEEWGADCIFLGTSAAINLLERFLLGNVATAIVARAHCSVEVVRSGY